MDKRITPEFGQKSKGKNKQSPHHPAVIEMVKLLARISAESDYNNHIIKHRKRNDKGTHSP